MRKGLSDIVTAILFILLILIAIGLIWAFLRPFISESLESQQGIESCYTLQLSPLRCEYALYVPLGYGPYENKRPLIVQTRRERGQGVLAGMDYVITSTTGESVRVSDQGSPLQELEQRQTTIYASVAESFIPQSIALAPLLNTSASCPLAGSTISCIPYEPPQRLCADFDCNTLIDSNDFFVFLNIFFETTLEGLHPLNCNYMQNSSGAQRICELDPSFVPDCADFDRDGITQENDLVSFFNELLRQPPNECP